MTGYATEFLIMPFVIKYHAQVEISLYAFLFIIITYVVVKSIKKRIINDKINKEQEEWEQMPKEKQAKIMELQKEKEDKEWANTERMKNK